MMPDEFHPRSDRRDYGDHKYKSHQVVLQSVTVASR